ncbi:antifreeze protein Maxi-like, partial [Cyclospora cayetanensis]|uniref:Antifreeze protein Maxi-like n=1 Tax=Cyclospora cayetanensis TaxID=88456 RepID=A0A6P6RTU3_9EIME
AAALSAAAVVSAAAALSATADCLQEEAVLLLQDGCHSAWVEEQTGSAVTTAAAVGKIPAGEDFKRGPLPPFPPMRVERNNLLSIVLRVKAVAGTPVAMAAASAAAASASAAASAASASAAAASAASASAAASAAAASAAAAAALVLESCDYMRLECLYTDTKVGESQGPRGPEKVCRVFARRF